MMRSEWKISDVSSLYAMKFLLMNPTPERSVSLDGVEVEACASILMVELVSKANITECRNVNIEAG